MKAHPITPSVAATPEALSSELGTVEAAQPSCRQHPTPLSSRRRLDIEVYVKPLPGASPFEVTKAIDKMLVMGASMDGAISTVQSA